MTEHPQNENGSAGTPPDGDNRNVVPTARVGLGIWFPPLVAALGGTVVTFALWHHRGDTTALILAALCALLGLILGGALWLVDRFAPAPQHMAALPTFSLGAFALLLVIMFRYDREIWRHPWMATVGLGLAVWCGGFSFASFRVWLGLPNADRLPTRLAAIGTLGLAILFASITVRDMLASARGLEVPTSQQALFAACVWLWIAVAVRFLWTARRQLTANTLLTMLLWPAALFFRAPLPAILTAGLVIGLAYAGAILGTHFGYPYTGALLVPAMLVAATATLMQFRH